MTRLNLATSNGFLFVDGKLRAYEFKSAIVNFSSGEVTYTCNLGGEEKTFTTDDCPKVYEDEDAFKAGDFLTGHHYTLAEAIRGAFFYVRDSINDSGECTMYAVKDNEVIAVPAPMDGFVFNGRTSHPASKQFYATREDALLHCDLIVVDEKGQETTTLSPAKRVALSEEQKEAVEALETALKRLNEVGVTLCMDTDSEDLYAFSKKDVKEWTWDCCRDEVINKYGYGINDLMTEVRNGSVLGWCFSDTTMYVKFKD